MSSESSKPPVFQVREIASTRDGEAIGIVIETQSHLRFQFNVNPVDALNLAHSIERAYHGVPRSRAEEPRAVPFDPSA